MKIFSRRDFLKSAALMLPGLAFSGKDFPLLQMPRYLEEETVGRVAIASVSVHKLPWDESTILYQRSRDEMINIYETVTSSYGPEYNPTWYRVWRGYVHAARVQLVKTRLNPVLENLPEEGQLGEITVPVTAPLHYNNKDTWTALYPLYYESVHWITGLVEGPDKTPWYQITEAWSKDKYYVPAIHVRLIQPQEIAPLSPEVPPEKKRIEVSIERQTVTAFEYDKEVFHTKVSTGLNKEVPGQIPWRTPTGKWNITSKMGSQRMGDDPITSDVSAYVLPGVPWVSYFHVTGAAFHGTYWHNNYGVPMSHGCINMTPEDAKWIFRWTTPGPVVEKRETRGMGTKIEVI